MEDIQLLETIVKAIVANPDKVKIERKVDEMGVLLELLIDPSDMGTIIGKEGKTAKALRTILRAFGAKNQARINLKIIEPEGSLRPPRPAPSEGSVAPAANSALDSALSDDI